MTLICSLHVQVHIWKVLTPSRPTLAPEIDASTAAGMLLHQIYSIEEVIVASVL